MGKSSIEWTDATWNPVTGCDRVSPGCAHCYALDLAARLKGMGQARYQRDGDPKTSGPGFGVTLHPDKLEEPLRWRKPRMIFVNSMSDLFHPEIPDEYIAQVFTAMDAAGRHIYQVLTKRPERMRDLLDSGQWRKSTGISDWPLPNVWLGTSIENRKFVARADALRDTLAAVRFISAEPLLGPLVGWAGKYGGVARLCVRCDRRFLPQHSHLYRREGWVCDNCIRPGEGIPLADRQRSDGLDLTGIDWLIVGGESGAQHRPIRPEWVRDLRAACLSQCETCALPANGNAWACETRTAFFFKQWGGRTPKSGGRELDGRTWDEMPQAATAPAEPSVEGALF